MYGNQVLLLRGASGGSGSVSSVRGRSRHDHGQGAACGGTEPPWCGATAACCDIGYPPVFTAHSGITRSCVPPRLHALFVLDHVLLTYTSTDFRAKVSLLQRGCVLRKNPPDWSAFFFTSYELKQSLTIKKQKKRLLDSVFVSVAGTTTVTVYSGMAFCSMNETD